ncbi:MAG: sulfotransferase family 2 domain-containing protein [Deltaproteobacteria bacterium]|nr:sulfotransferase family 2 domain-containing protein [Deltaproteobacteria bacterium]
MLISLKYKFLFVHIAKTGGTSIRAALRWYKWKDPYRIPFFLCSRISALFGHRLACKIPRHAKIITAYEMLPRELFNELFKFAFVRNPWDLQVSSYHHIKRERPHLLKGIHDFESFLRWKLDPSRPYHYIIDTSMELQYDYLIDLDGNVIVDFIGRYEQLEDDFNEACRRIGIRPPKLPHKRRARDRLDYREYYTEETAELIAQRFKKDIEMLGYSFDG